MKPHWWVFAPLDKAGSGLGQVGVVGQAGGLGHGVRLVNPETVYAAIKPKFEDVFKLGLNLSALPIEIGLR